MPLECFSLFQTAHAASSQIPRRCWDLQCLSRCPGTCLCYQSLQSLAPLVLVELGNSRYLETVSFTFKGWNHFVGYTSDSQNQLVLPSFSLESVNEFGRLCLATCRKLEEEVVVFFHVFNTSILALVSSTTSFGGVVQEMLKSSVFLSPVCWLLSLAPKVLVELFSRCQSYWLTLINQIPVLTLIVWFSCDPNSFHISRWSATSETGVKIIDWL